MEQHAEAIRALVQAQIAMERARAAQTNPHFRSKYADLADIQDACLPALQANGFAVLQPLGRDEHGDFVDTVFLHETGWEIRARAYLRMNKDDMQGYGSAVTYARRYGLASLAGITDEDDDGNAAAKARSPQLSTRASAGEPGQLTPLYLDLFISHMDKAISHQELAEIWSAHRDLQRMPGAIAAKDRNKLRLAAPPYPDHAGSEFGLPSVDPHVPPSSDCPF